MSGSHSAGTSSTSGPDPTDPAGSTPDPASQPDPMEAIRQKAAAIRAEKGETPPVPKDELDTQISVKEADLKLAEKDVADVEVLLEHALDRVHMLQVELAELHEQRGDAPEPDPASSGSRPIVPGMGRASRRPSGKRAAQPDAGQPKGGKFMGALDRIARKLEGSDPAADK
jgi:hypothetical protein